MSPTIRFDVAPFDNLTPSEQRGLQDNARWREYAAGSVLLAEGDAPTEWLVVGAGEVQRPNRDAAAAVHHEGDCLDVRGLLSGRISDRFVARTDVWAWAVDRQVLLDLVSNNRRFAAALFTQVGTHLAAEDGVDSVGRQWQTLHGARLADAPLRAPVMVDAAADIVSVVRVLQAQDCTNVLVQGVGDMGTEMGMFTVTALKQAILHGTPLERLPVGELARYPLIKLDANALVGDALVTMLRHGIHRVVVTEDGRLRGVLEALDLFSFLANHSHLVARAIEQARDLDELAEAAAQITTMIGRQYQAGTRVSLIAHLVRELNAHLFDRAWHMIAPADLVQNSCLFVMGSEGRGEQLLKTDQDNGLVLRDGYQAPPDLIEICQRFSDALARFGYPECPGGIMLSRPDWRATVSDFSARVRHWLREPDGDSLMHLAIFMDAHAVSGDADLLQQVRASLFSLSTDDDGMLTRFAAAVEVFGSRLGWWNRLRGNIGQRLNLKKEGIFPLVHGVRAMALAARVFETGTTARLDALVKAGDLTASMSQELTEALHFLMKLRLQAGLDDQQRGQPVSGALDVASLSTQERDRLKSSLSVVRDFKAILRRRFRLDLT